MTVLEVFETGAKFAINDVTGEIVRKMRSGAPEIVVRGDIDRPDVVCTLLFDEEAIDNAWESVDEEVAIKRMAAAAKGTEQFLNL